jgi:hypothetical protein
MEYARSAPVRQAPSARLRKGDVGRGSRETGGRGDTRPPTSVDEMHGEVTTPSHSVTSPDLKTRRDFGRATLDDGRTLPLVR